jgi:hypothetical protein
MVMISNAVAIMDCDDIVRGVFMILLANVMLAAPTSTVPGPALRSGDEIVYRGDIVDESTRFDAPFKRGFRVEVRAVVMEQSAGSIDLAVMTSLEAVADAKIVKAAAAVAGAANETAASVQVRYELVRWPASGELRLLFPELGPPPVSLKAATRSLPMPLPANDAPNPAEVGPFTARPLGEAKGSVVIDGAETIEYAMQQSHAVWSMTERHWISPADGLTRVVWRRVDHPVAGRRIETRLDLQPLIVHRGDSADRLRREVEFAWWFGVQADDPKSDKTALVARIERYREDVPATTFRPAIESALRRARGN